jgi:RING-like zinc finger
VSNSDQDIALNHFNENDADNIHASGVEDLERDHDHHDDDDETENKNENQCSICLGALMHGNLVIKTNHCEHVFHVDCSMG